MATYIETTEHFGRTESKVNATSFAKDLAAKLGGEYQSRFEDDIDKDYRGTFVLEGNRFHISRSWNPKLAGQVQISVDCDVQWHQVGSMPYVSEYRHEYRLREIKVSVERPIEAIAKDVRKRLIAANAEALKARREYYNSQISQQSDVANAKDAIAKRIGHLVTLRLNDRAETGSFNVKGYYCHGRFDSNSITIDRLGSVTLDQFEAILELLTATKKEKEAA